jgi:hypothetical protein
MVKAHQRNVTLVALQNLDDRLGKSLVVSVATLEFQNQGDLAAAQLQKLFERRDMIPRTAD